MDTMPNTPNNAPIEQQAAPTQAPVPPAPQQPAAGAQPPVPQYTPQPEPPAFSPQGGLYPPTQGTDPAFNQMQPPMPPQGQGAIPPQMPYGMPVDYVPEEVKGWNWGAFVFSAVWGIGNQAYLPLLCLIPYFGFIWMFVCGAKGNEWAWKGGRYTDIYLFKHAQESWNRAGKIVFFIWLGLLILGLFVGLLGGLTVLFNF